MEDEHVQHYISAFNKGDAKTMVAAFASSGSILDGMPPYLWLTGNSAYVVVPASMTFKLRDQQINQTGAIYTVALNKIADDWRIVAWSWAKSIAK